MFGWISRTRGKPGFVRIVPSVWFFFLAGTIIIWLGAVVYARNPCTSRTRIGFTVIGRYLSILFFLWEFFFSRLSVEAFRKTASARDLIKSILKCFRVFQRTQVDRSLRSYEKLAIEKKKSWTGTVSVSPWWTGRYCMWGWVRLGKVRVRLGLG